VSSHLAVNDALLVILKNKVPASPPTLLKAAYVTMVSTLQHEHGRALDADYLRGRSITRGPTPLYINMKLRMAQIPI
jgi:hypothetical protein